MHSAAFVVFEYELPQRSHIVTGAQTDCVESFHPIWARLGRLYVQSGSPSSAGAQYMHPNASNREQVHACPIR